MIENSTKSRFGYSSDVKNASTRNNIWKCVYDAMNNLNILWNKLKLKYVLCGLCGYGWIWFCHLLRIFFLWDAPENVLKLVILPFETCRKCYYSREKYTSELNTQETWKWWQKFVIAFIWHFVVFLFMWKHRVLCTSLKWNNK